jgi:hypothetical protein
MGFRSTFVTEHTVLHFPPWFVEKWGRHVHFGDDHGLPLASKYEAKCYDTWGGLEEDIARALAERHAADAGQMLASIERVVLVWLHECGGLTRVEITANSVRYNEPATWREEDAPMHSYCYGCSDLPPPDDAP